MEQGKEDGSLNCASDEPFAYGTTLVASSQGQEHKDSRCCQQHAYYYYRSVKFSPHVLIIVYLVSR